MAIILLKKLIIQKHSLDFLTILACVTLSYKYQDSPSQSIDYQRLAQSCHIDNIHHIHVSLSLSLWYHLYKIILQQNAELHLLDVFSYDICMTTPDHFFSYLSNLTNNDHNLKQIIEQARSSLSNNSLSHQTLGKSLERKRLTLVCSYSSNDYLLFRSSPQLSIEYCNSFSHL